MAFPRGRRESADWLISPREQMRRARTRTRETSPPPPPARPLSADSWEAVVSSTLLNSSSLPVSYLPRSLSTRQSSPPPQLWYQPPPIGQYAALREQAEARQRTRQTSIRRPPVPSPPPSSPRPPPPRPLNTSHHPFPLLSILTSHLSHTHTALSGLEALTLHGCPLRLPLNHPLTLLCPTSDLPIVRSWSVAAGWEVRHRGSQSQSYDEIIISTTEFGAEASHWSWTVRVEGVERDKWEEMEARMVVRHGVRVLGLGDLLDEFAGRWVRTEERGAAQAVNWILEALVMGGGEDLPLPVWRLRNVVADGFRDRFVGRCPESRPFFELCGLGAVA
ncbi:hypothetical protein B0T16DRAFT_452466 [Cercophora newfieldiana]|uniref:Uncharacterized protein n=1 Tax=Cercophora newfieldiana TaxID=92897 RepID=A0AA40CZ48_9PEZI|nr:hypothetical protein B0T16DRAFT_452466 [Cercophora newfieldiana]